MKIRCLIIRKDRSICTRKVDSSKANFTFNHGLYTIPRESVNISEYKGIKGKQVPELIYFEDDALPVNSGSENAQSFLEYVVLENALKQVSAPKGMLLDILSDYARSPGKLLLLAFAFIIVVSFLMGVIE